MTGPHPGGLRVVPRHAPATSALIVQSITKYGIATKHELTELPATEVDIISKARRSHAINIYLVERNNSRTISAT